MRSGWPTPATSATASSSSSCARARSGRGALPRRLRRRRRQRRAADAGRVHALRRGAGPVPGDRPRRCPKPWPDERAAGCGIRQTTSLDALPLARLYAAATPAPGRPARGHPARRLGAPGDALARAALQPDADPALRRRRGLRPGHARRRQGRDAARRLPPDRRRQGGPAALPQAHRPARGERGRPARLRSGRDRGTDDARAATTATTTASSPRCEPTNHRSTVAWRRRASTRSPA